MNTSLNFGDKSMKHLLIDVETLGIHEDSVILQFTGMIYNTQPEPEDTIQQFLDNCSMIDLKLSVEDQHRFGRKIDPDTVKWWSNQPTSVQQHVFIPNENDLPADEAMSQFESWLKENKFNKKRDTIWQRGTQDILWISSLFMSCGWIFDQIPIAWYRVRDLRTAVDVLGQSTKLNGYPDNTDELRALVPNYKQHDSKSDIMLEALILRQAGVL
jgi:hypothetical protein